MGHTAAQAMNFELTGKKEMSKQATKKAERVYDVRKMSISEVLWFEFTSHWVGLLATVGVTYIVFDNFGTLIIGLVKGMFN